MTERAPIGRFRFMDAQRVNLDGFAVEEPSLGLVAFGRSVLVVAPMTHELEDPPTFLDVVASLRPARFVLLRTHASPASRVKSVRSRSASAAERNAGAERTATVPSRTCPAVITGLRAPCR